jgi:hypothetical protein
VTFTMTPGKGGSLPHPRSPARTPHFHLPLERREARHHPPGPSRGRGRRCLFG